MALTLWNCEPTALAAGLGQVGTELAERGMFLDSRPDASALGSQSKCHLTLARGFLPRLE
jgi:hypothetical protein